MTSVQPRFYDTHARTPLPPPDTQGRPLSFYACGITPYAATHIGHGRSYVVFDLMTRVLRDAGHAVELVRNITDVDDKIIAAAAAGGQDWHVLAHGHARHNTHLLGRLGAVGHEEPSASDHIQDIIALGVRLQERGHAYINPETGDLLFEVATFRGTDLVRHQVQDLAEHRVDARGKRDPADFVLWKPAKPGEPSWPSPWGQGRPGWHAECSAMIDRRFGGRVDYHGGGVDLRFPHHQAEIMQSEAAHGHPLASRWVHHGSVRDGQGRKMSKSLGNTVGLEQALDEAEHLAPGQGGDVVRLALLSALWTRPLDWHDRILGLAAQHLDRWQQAAVRAAGDGQGMAVREALYDNLNTPLAISRLHGLAGQALEGDLHAANEVRKGLELLGLASQPVPRINPHQDRIDELVARREALRAQKRWQEADQLREELAQLGYTVRDGVVRKPG